MFVTGRDTDTDVGRTLARSGITCWVLLNAVVNKLFLRMEDCFLVDGVDEDSGGLWAQFLTGVNYCCQLGQTSVSATLSSRSGLQYHCIERGDLFLVSGARMYRNTNNRS